MRYDGNRYRKVADSTATKFLFDANNLRFSALLFELDGGETVQAKYRRGPSGLLLAMRRGGDGVHVPLRCARIHARIDERLGDEDGHVRVQRLGESQGFPGDDGEPCSVPRAPGRIRRRGRGAGTGVEHLV